MADCHKSLAMILSERDACYRSKIMSKIVYSRKTEHC